MVIASNHREHAEIADQMLAIGNTAFVLGGSLYLFSYDDPAPNPSG
jgi:hypothetical protein